VAFVTRSSFLLLFAAVGGAFACNAILGIEDVEHDFGTGPLGDAGTDAPIDPQCEPSPRDDSSVLRDGCGIFAALTGLDGAAGTRDAPVKSLARAIELALAKRLPHVYLCAGTYTDPVHIDGAQAHFNMGIYGGLSCLDHWAYTGERVKVQTLSGL